MTQSASDSDLFKLDALSITEYSVPASEDRCSGLNTRSKDEGCAEEQLLFTEENTHGDKYTRFENA
jgi:hypothetical protein